MPGNELPEISFEGLSLVPLDEPASKGATDQASKAVVDTRHQKDRRKQPDRRGSVRFEEARRAGKSRRQDDSPWSPGAGI